MSNAVFQISLIYILVFSAVRTQKYLSKPTYRMFFVFFFVLYSSSVFAFFLLWYRFYLADWGLALVAGLAAFPEITRASIFKFGRTYAGVARDGVFNIILFCASYLICINNSLSPTAVAGMVFLMLARVGMTIYYRINFANEVYIHEIAQSKKARLHKLLLPIQPLADYGTRTLIHFYLSNTLICIAIFFSGLGPRVPFTEGNNFAGHSSGLLVVDTLYFVIVTIHTVGFGDLYPATAYAKLFVSALILFSAVLIAFILTDLFNFTLALSQRERKDSGQDSPPSQ